MNSKVLWHTAADHRTSVLIFFSILLQCSFGSKCYHRRIQLVCHLGQLSGWMCIVRGPCFELQDQVTSSFVRMPLWNLLKLLCKNVLTELTSGLHSAPLRPLSSWSWLFFVMHLLAVRHALLGVSRSDGLKSWYALVCSYVLQQGILLLNYIVQTSGFLYLCVHRAWGKGSRWDRKSVV